MRDLFLIVVLGFAGIKGLVWVCGNTALALASAYWVPGQAIIDNS
jgi:hypothetical protein